MLNCSDYIQLTVLQTMCLQWQKQRTPLATGCSFYDCSPNGESLLIQVEFTNSCNNLSLAYMLQYAIQLKSPKQMLNMFKWNCRKATVYVESPLKPGRDCACKQSNHAKTRQQKKHQMQTNHMTFYCQNFDKFSEPGQVYASIYQSVTGVHILLANRRYIWIAGVLEKPHAMIQCMTKAYKILIESFILPLLVYHTHLWTYGARLLSYLLNILQTLLKIFMW